MVARGVAVADLQDSDAFELAGAQLLERALETGQRLARRLRLLDRRVGTLATQPATASRTAPKISMPKRNTEVEGMPISGWS